MRSKSKLGWIDMTKRALAKRDEIINILKKRLGEDGD